MNAAEAFGQYLALVQANAGILDREPDLLANIREQATEDAADLIETYKADKDVPAECRTTSLYAPDYGINLSHIDMTADIAASFHCGVPNLNCYLAVVVNDVVHFTDTLGRLPEGLEIYSLRDVPAKYSEESSDLISRGFPVGSLLLTDGIYIRVAEGCRVDKPIQIVNIFKSDTPLLTPRRIIVDAKPESAVRILICDHSQSPAMQHLSSEAVVHVSRYTTSKSPHRPHTGIVNSMHSKPAIPNLSSIRHIFTVALLQTNTTSKSMATVLSPTSVAWPCSQANK